MMMSGKLALNEVATIDEDPNMKADCFMHNNLQVIAFKAIVDIQKDSEDQLKTVTAIFLNGRLYMVILLYLYICCVIFGMVIIDDDILYH